MGEPDDSAQLESILTVRRCFVHLKTGVRESGSQILKKSGAKVESIFRDFDGFIEEIFKAQEFFVFFRIAAELFPTHSQFDCQAG
jgi:hypothetical protein